MDYKPYMTEREIDELTREVDNAKELLSEQSLRRFIEHGWDNVFSYSMGLQQNYLCEGIMALMSATEKDKIHDALREFREDLLNQTALIVDHYIELANTPYREDKETIARVNEITAGMESHADLINNEEQIVEKILNLMKEKRHD